MGRMCLVSLWFGIAFMIGKANCRENEVFAFPGCNSTLEWSIGSEYAMALAHSMKVFSAKGIQIAEKEGMACKNVTDSSIYCEVRNTSSEEWRFSVVLFNVTQANSGNYTGQIKFGPKEANITTKLIVIDEPQIKEARKPILHEPLRITCTIHSEFEVLVYYWKLNGTYLNSTERIYTGSSNLTFERLTLADKFSTFSCGVCSSINCCIESDTYAPDPYYGPDNVTLSLNNSDIYLRVNETLKVICSAKCYPVCTFLWDGYIDSENEELVIDSFNSRMVGAYSCIAKNNNTGVTVKSDPIFLHYVQDASAVSSSPGENGDSIPEENEGHRLKQYWMGQVIVCVFLLIVGFLILVTHWRKATARGINFRELCRPCVRQADSEASPKRLDRPLSILPVQENVSSRTKKFEYPDKQRISREPQNLSDQTQSFRNLVRENLPLQTLVQSSNTNERQTRNLVKTDDSIDRQRGYKCYSWPCSMQESADMSRLIKLLAKVKTDDNVINNNQNTPGKPEAINNSEQEYLSPKLEENLYSTIDEDDMSLYDDGIDNVITKLSHEAGKSTEHILYDYADVHVTDETYITPISDLDSPFEIVQDEERDVPEIDHTYLTLIDDYANPNKICQVEETDMNEIDRTIITPVTG